MAKDFGVPHISTGEIFRKEYQRGTELGEEAYGWWGKGHWVPDELTLKVLEPYLEETDKGFILDAFPRTVGQCSLLDDYLSSRGGKLDRVILVDVSDEEAVKRLLLRAKIDIKEKGKARVDEDEEIVRERLKSYRQTIASILAFYEEKGILERVDGERPIEEIHKDILKRLKNDQPQGSGRD